MPTEVAFFGADDGAALAAARRQADLIAANNVLAHVPDLHDFVAGFTILLKPEGVVTFEFPHLLRLIARVSSTRSTTSTSPISRCWSVERVFARHGLRLFDVERLADPWRLAARLLLPRRGCGARRRPSGVGRCWRDERAAGLDRLETYDGFAPRVVEAKCDAAAIPDRRASASGKTVAGYGAPAKGNTLLNYCGIGPELMAFTVDRSPHKQGRFLPGTRIPILAPERCSRRRPDYVLILPWNLEDEIIGQMARRPRLGRPLRRADPASCR